LETIQKLLKAEVSLTKEIADKIEKVTWMNAEGMMRLETRYRNDLVFVQQNPDYPVV
jgi:plasmid maintenance system antidote protein VapI